MTTRIRFGNQVNLDEASSTLTATTNDLSLSYGASVLRLDSDAARTLTGIVHESGFERWLMVYNAGNYVITLSDEDSGSTAAYRFHTTSGENYKLAVDECVWLYYDITDSRWRICPTKGTYPIEVILGDGINAITTGVKGHIDVQQDGIIQSVKAMSTGGGGDVVVDIWKNTYTALSTGSPPVDSDSITSACPVTITAGSCAYDPTLSGWTTTLSEGDVLTYNVDSCSTIKQVTVSLKVLKV